MIEDILVSTLVKTFATLYKYILCTKSCLGNAQNVVLCTHLPGVAPGADGFIMSRWGVNFCSNITHSNIQPLEMAKRKMTRYDAIPSTSIRYCLCPCCYVSKHCQEEGWHFVAHEPFNVMLSCFVLFSGKGPATNIYILM